MSKVFGLAIHGWAATMVVMAMLNGLILLYIGTVVGYISRIHAEVMNRPRYVIRRDLTQLHPGDHSKTEGNEKKSSGKGR